MSIKPIYRVTTMEQKPFTIYNNSTGLWSGLCIDLLEEFANTLNFTYEIREPSDKKYGNLNFTTMEWNGMIRELIDGNVDMAVAPIWMTHIRESVIDFTEPIYEMNGISFVMKNNRRQVSFFRFLTNFEPILWLSFFGVFLFTSILLYFLERFSPYSYRNSREKDKNESDGRFCHLKECFWFVLTSLIAGGGDELPKNLSGKLCTVTWWLFSFIISAAYTANFGAHQTSLRMEGHIESFDDLRRQYKIEYSVVYGSPTYEYFASMVRAEEVLYKKWESMTLNDSISSQEKLQLNVWEYPIDDIYTRTLSAMNSSGFSRNVEEAVARVRGTGDSRPFAFVTEEVNVRYLILTSCDLVHVDGRIARKPYAIGLQQGSPLKNKLNFVIRKLYAERKMDRLKRKWWDENPERIFCEYETRLNDGIGMKYMAAVFCLILLGILLSIMILSIQYWWYYYVPRNVLKNNKRTMVISDIISRKIDIART